MCVYGEAHKECVSNSGTNTRKEGRGGEGRGGKALGAC